MNEKWLRFETVSILRIYNVLNLRTWNKQAGVCLYWIAHAHQQNKVLPNYTKDHCETNVQLPNNVKSLQHKLVVFHIFAAQLVKLY